MHYHGHRERLRGRLQHAPQELADYEILEMLLGYVILRADTKPIAKELLARFGTLRGVVQARPEAYEDIAGLGKGVIAFFQLLREFLPRYVESPVREREILCDLRAVANMARERLGTITHEEVWVAYVDKGNRLIRWEQSTRGSVDVSLINSRDIVERALALKAAGVIVVHNHPGGNHHPSPEDAEVTNRLHQALRTVFIKLLDHIIVTEQTCYSIITRSTV